MSAAPINEQQVGDCGPYRARLSPEVCRRNRGIGREYCEKCPGLQNLEYIAIGKSAAPPPFGRKALLTEFQVGHYYRQFSLSEGLDQNGITAALKEGVLRLTLPRLAPAQPRKIEITRE